VARQGLDCAGYPSHQPTPEATACGHQLRGHPEPLLEAELFGYVKGSFTGAVQSRIGGFTRRMGGRYSLTRLGYAALSAKQDAALSRAG